MKENLLAVYLIALLVLLMAGAKIAKKGTFFDDFLDLSVAKGLQGFAAVAIMLHHLTQKLTQYGQIDKGPIGVVNDVGVLLTGMFFFFSGYGLYLSYVTKEDYLGDFLKKRLPTVLIPFYSTNTVFVLLNLILGYEMNVAEFFLYITGLVLLNSQMWYIVEIVFLYLAFYVIFKKIKKQNAAFLCMAGFMAFMTVGSLLLGHDYKYACQGAWFKGEWWYNSTWLFFVGMLIARYRETVICFAKKKYAVLMPAGVVLFGLLHMATLFMLRNVGYWKEYEGHPGYLEKALTWVVQTPTVAVFVLIFLLLTMKIQFRNQALTFLGKIAIELYLIHNIFILYLLDAVKNDFFFCFCVYTGGVGLALGIHSFDRWLIGKVCRTKA